MKTILSILIIIALFTLLMNRCMYAYNKEHYEYEFLYKKKL
jgi:hypothetical protein